MSGLIWALLWPPAFGFLTARRGPFAVGVTAGALGVILGSAVRFFVPGVAAGCAWLLVALWHWTRDKRRRVLAALGNKARARLAAMAARLRECPRVAVRPLPQASP